LYLLAYRVRFDCLFCFGIFWLHVLCWSDSNVLWLVTPAALDALDFLIWTNSGYRAAELCCCHQSSISRRAQETAAAFGLSLVRERSAWQLKGPMGLLDLEREVHQLHRLLRGSGLRLEVAMGLASLMPRLVSKAWIPVCVETTADRSLGLLEGRVVDGWITMLPAAAIQGQGGLVRYDLTEPLPSGAALVVRRELGVHPVCDQLLELLARQTSDPLPLEMSRVRSSC
jgi:hypothetical protein